MTKIFLWLKIFFDKKNVVTNCKTLPWEHHIGCQMCQMTPSKNCEKVFKNKIKKIKQKSFSSDSSCYHSEENCKTSKKNLFCWALLERAIWHIWQHMWCSQGSVLRFSRCFLDNLNVRFWTNTNFSVLWRTLAQEHIPNIGLWWHNCQ